MARLRKFNSKKFKDYLNSKFKMNVPAFSVVAGVSLPTIYHMLDNKYCAEHKFKDNPVIVSVAKALDVPASELMVTERKRHRPVENHEENHEEMPEGEFAYDRVCDAVLGKFHTYRAAGIAMHLDPSHLGKVLCGKERYGTRESYEKIAKGIGWWIEDMFDREEENNVEEMAKSVMAETEAYDDVEKEPEEEPAAVFEADTEEKTKAVPEQRKGIRFFIKDPDTIADEAKAEILKSIKSVSENIQTCPESDGIKKLAEAMVDLVDALIKL